MSLENVVTAAAREDARKNKTPVVTAWARRALLGMAGVYLLACSLPAVRVFSAGGFVPGILCLLLGLWFTLFWLANPLLWLGWVFLWCGANLPALLCGFLATLLAASFGLLTTMELSWGFYVWQASMVLLAAVAGACLYIDVTARVSPAGGDGVSGRDD